MYIVVFCSLLALLLTHLEVKGQVKNGMLWGFVVLTLLGCIHYDYGNDYMSYYGVYKDIENLPFDIEAILDGTYYREPGWALLCFAFKPIGGFFMMVAVLNIIQNYIYYSAIVKYVPRKYWAYSVFFYLFTINFYVMNFSMMRQGFTVAVFFAMWPLLRDKKIWISIPLIFALSFVHTSAKILYPFAFLGFLPQNKKTSTIITSLLVFFWLLLITNGTLVQLVFENMLVMSTFEHYADTYEQANNAGSFGLGTLIYLSPFFTLVYFLLKDTEQSAEIRYMAIFAMIHTVIAPFNHIIHIIGRISIYFGTFSILCYPIVYSSIKNERIRYVLGGLLGFIILYDYCLFFWGDGWEAFKVFHTIFETL